MKTQIRFLIIVTIIIILMLVGMFLYHRNNKILSYTIKNIKDTEKENRSILNQKVDNVKYFLSEVELVENVYMPSLVKCLVDENGNEIYVEWSAIYHPAYPPHKIALVRVEFQDKGISLNKTCFIKEIITEEDWGSIKKYNFFKERFVR